MIDKTVTALLCRCGFLLVREQSQGVILEGGDFRLRKYNPNLLTE